MSTTPRPSARATPRRIGPKSAGIAMTIDEFDSLPEGCWDDRFRYELIRGILVVTPPPGAAERDLNGELEFLLRLHQVTHAAGACIDKTLAEQTVPTTPNRRRADRVIWVGLGRTPDVLADIPSIVIEFVSARRRDAIRDYQEKRDEYLAAGVREYWVIDRFRRSLTVYRTDPPETVVGESQFYESPLLPGFVLPLGQLLARADDWSRRLPKPPPSG